MVYWKLEKVTPTNSVVTIVEKHENAEYLRHLLALIELRFQIDTKIAMTTGDISEEEGNNLLENTYYKVTKT